MSTSRKAIIIGAGPTGLSAALRLLQTTNVQPEIYELRPELTTMGGAIGIPSNGLRLFDHLGVAESFLQRGSSRSDVAIFSLAQGKLGYLSDFPSHARAETGHGYIRIKRVDIVESLLEAVQNAGIPIHFDRRIVQIESNPHQNSIRVQFEDGATDEADMLFGCDGIHSSVRVIYVDPMSKPEYSGVSGIFSTIPTSLVSSSVTSQLSGLSATLTGQGMFMAAPCTASGNEIYWGFQHEIPVPDQQHSRDGWEVRGREEVENFKERLHQVLAGGQGDWIDALRGLVDATDVMKFYPVYRLPLGGTWSRGRCLLLGDAAHAMQPHAGQGVSLAIEDVFLICRLLQDPNRPIEEAYASFERIRRPRVANIHETAAQNAGTRRTVGAEEQLAKERSIQLELAKDSGKGIADRMLGQKYATYDIETALN